MFFLIRAAFWLSLVLLVIPFGVSQGSGSNSVGPVQALSAAREAVGDIAGMCERKPDVCETGRSAFHTIGVRAREGAKLAYQYLDEKLGEEPAGDAGMATGSIPAAD